MCRAFIRVRIPCLVERVVAIWLLTHPVVPSSVDSIGWDKYRGYAVYRIAGAAVIFALADSKSPGGDTVSVRVRPLVPWMISMPPFVIPSNVLIFLFS
ncbi:hypothetical protein R84865_002064 [Carnimonas sp. R-84865]